MRRVGLVLPRAYIPLAGQLAVKALGDGGGNHGEAAGSDDLCIAQVSLAKQLLGATGQPAVDSSCNAASGTRSTENTGARASEQQVVGGATTAPETEQAMGATAGTRVEPSVGKVAG